MKQTKAHIRYKNNEGKVVPGVTTILGVLNKPALVPWANRLGLEGIDSSKYVDKLATIGTLAHYLIACDLKGESADLEGYSQDEVDKAENSLISYFEWKKRLTIEVILVEEPLVSEIYQFGGTIDLLAKINNELVLIDFKTGSGIYDEYVYQVAAYEQLALATHSSEIAEKRIVRIGRTENEGFEERIYKDLSKHWQIFKACLEIYNLKKEIRSG